MGIITHFEAAMVRTQILLDDEQRRYLEKLSAETGESLSALVRQAVMEMKQRLTRREAREEFRKFLGTLQSEGSKGAARHHDEFLAEAYRA